MIKIRFGPDWKIENPNQPHHQEGCNAYKNMPDKNVMDYFYEKVLPSCDACIGLPFGDGKFGKGVYGEMEWFRNLNRLVYIIQPNGYISAPITFMSQHQGLSIEETRARVREADGKTTKAYE